jgi:hypothetical protein
MINAALGALIGLPLAIVGKSRVGKASRLLSGEESMRAIDSQRKKQSLDVAEPKSLPVPGSVTERTTLDLSRHRKP